MVSRGEEKYVIWPIYLDKSISREEGRKIARKHAVEKPTVESIAKAAQSLGLHPIVDKTAAHPLRHWKNEGRVLVDKKDAKSKLLVKIANHIGKF